MSNVESFEEAGKDILGPWGCVPMIAFGTCKTLSAFKLLARARNIEPRIANSVSKQIQSYELDLKQLMDKENPDEDMADMIHIEDYVDKQYIPLLEDSYQYKGIVTSISPHPCAHLLLDKDVRREIGVIRVKAKTGNKDAIYAAYIDGQTADAYGYLKARIWSLLQ